MGGDEARAVGKTQKLQPKCKGAYQILEVVDQVTFRLEQLAKLQKSKSSDTFHVSKLKSDKEYDQDVKDSLDDHKSRIAKSKISRKSNESLSV